MIGAIVKWAVGGGLSSLTGSLERAYKAKLDAQNDAERLDADKQIAFFQGQIELAQNSINEPWYAPRTLMGYAAAGYVVKTVFYDSTLGLGVTPDPGPQVAGIVMVVVGFYFGSKAATDVATRIFASWRRK